RSLRWAKHRVTRPTARGRAPRRSISSKREQEGAEGGKPRMDSPNADPFVRFSTALLEALLRFQLTGVQLRIILWVLRNDDGWNRRLTPFRWYQIAKKLGSDRAAVWRSGQALLRANVLLLEAGAIGVQKDAAQWRIPRLRPAAEEVRPPGVAQ